jgi:membrane protein
MRLRGTWSLLASTVRAWQEDKAPTLAAALAFYTSISIAPVIVLVIAIAALALGHEAAQERLFVEIQGLLGPQAAEFIRGTIRSSQRQGGSLWATVISAAAVIAGATSVFAQLQASLDAIWHVKPSPKSGVFSFVRTRIVSFGMIVAIGFLLVVSLVVSAALTAFSGLLSQIAPWLHPVARAADLIISIGVVSLLFAAVFKYLPDAKVRWRDVWIGAVMTAILFTLGKFLIGLYLGRSATISTFGAAGSFVILLLYVYYSSQILFLGAEFTRAYAGSRGRDVKPSEHAEPA